MDDDLGFKFWLGLDCVSILFVIFIFFWGGGVIF